MTASLRAVEEAVKELDYPPVTAGLVESPEELVLHHINLSNNALNTWMVEEVRRLTGDGDRVHIGRVSNHSFPTITNIHKKSYILILI